MNHKNVLLVVQTSLIKMYSPDSYVYKSYDIQLDFGLQMTVVNSHFSSITFLLCHREGEKYCDHRVCLSVRIYVCL